MGNYSFCFRSDGRTLSTRKYDLEGDLDALDLARLLSVEHEIEVWHADRFVARVKKGDEPSDVSDSRAG